MWRVHMLSICLIIVEPSPHLLFILWRGKGETILLSKLCPLNEFVNSLAHQISWWTNWLSGSMEEKVTKKFFIGDKIWGLVLRTPFKTFLIAQPSGTNLSLPGMFEFSLSGFPEKFLPYHHSFYHLPPSQYLFPILSSLVLTSITYIIYEVWSLLSIFSYYQMSPKSSLRD